MPEVVVPLAIRDLTAEDLPSCSWLGSASYLASVNPRARALYERLGNILRGREPASWDTEGADGSRTRYETVCTLMRKQLP